MDWRDQIEIIPNIKGGKPVIKDLLTHTDDLVVREAAKRLYIPYLFH